ncbi:MAG: Do family serine endopeptidase [Bryobacterales bacterium]|nr:Do family serine endopeptidase [Bryobacterales bacterium]
MKSWLKRYLPGVALCALVAVGSSLIIHAIATPDPAKPATGIDASVYASDEKGPQAVAWSFAETLKKARRSVVNIQVEKVSKTPAGMRQIPFPFGPFGQPDPDDDGARRSRGAGSGVVVSAEGYILTNNHVVEDADEVSVTYFDGRSTKAKVVGTDPATDLAVLKVDVKDLHPIDFANSETVEVGDLAFAIGNPLGIGQTVTMGIVSATGRGSMGIIGVSNGNAGYEDFIQTDAAINRGNSGGALITADGRLMGINTAIVSSSGGNDGIGFSIPVNMARFVMDQLIANGKVQRAMIGALLQDVDDSMAKALGMDRPMGAMVNEVMPGKPAQKAGVQAGDVITKVEGREMRNQSQARNTISMMKPGSKINLTVNRDGKEISVPVTLAPLDDAAAEAPRVTEEAAGMNGVSVEELSTQLRRQLRIEDDVEGVLVGRVAPASKAASAGLRRGDVVVAIDRQPVRNTADFERLMKSSKGDATFMQVKRATQGRGWTNLFLGIER